LVHCAKTNLATLCVWPVRFRKRRTCCCTTEERGRESDELEKKEKAGLPDGIFFIPKMPNLVHFGKAIGTETFGVFHDNLVFFVAILEYFMSIWCFYCHFGIFVPFWFVVQKIWQCDQDRCYDFYIFS
jgi:hypothetical protein